MTVDDLIGEVHARGLTLQNLFEYERGGVSVWQANLAGPDWYSEFGVAATPHEALQKALREADVHAATQKPKRAKQLSFLD